MKLLYCIGAVSQKGGAEKVFSNKANYFADILGWEIHVLVDDNTTNFAYNFSSKIKFHFLNSKQYLSGTTIPFFSYKKLIKRLKPIYDSKINELKPDIIVVVQHGFADYIIPNLQKNDVPTVREFHTSKKASLILINVRVNNFFLKIKERLRLQNIFKLFNKYNYLVLLSNKDQKEGGYKTKTVVIPNMLDQKPRQNTAIERINKKAISIGSMRDNGKQFDLQIRVWKRIVEIKPDWKLEIYGDGKCRRELQMLIDKLKLNNNVALCGITDNVEEKLLASDFFLFTSKAEGFGMVLIEAMSCGIPCISFDTPEGPADIISDGVDGFLIPYGNEVGLYEKILYLINNPEELHSMSKQASIKSYSYSPEVIIPKWIEFFQSIKNK